MRKTCITLPLAALLLAGLGQAHAGSERIEVQGELLRAPDSTMTAELTGSYVLDDGRVLAVSRRGRQLHVALDAGPSAVLLARSPTRLQTADGRLQLAFRAAANGNVDQVRLTEPVPAERLALR